MGSSFRDTKHTRHIAQCYHYVRDNVANKRFIMCWIPRYLQMADSSTKQNPGPRHLFLTAMIQFIIKNHDLVQEG